MINNYVQAIYNNTVTIEEINQLNLNQIQQIKQMLHNYALQGYIIPQNESYQRLLQREAQFIFQMQEQQRIMNENAPYKITKKNRKERNFSKLTLGIISFISAIVMLYFINYTNNIITSTQVLQNGRTIVVIGSTAAIIYLITSILMIASFWNRKSNAINYLVIAGSIISITLYGLIIRSANSTLNIIIILLLALLYTILISKKAKTK
jgi:hypothetical protein